MAVEFDQKSYWHERFSSETSFEWLLPSEKFLAIIQPQLDQLDLSARILHIGSGTSDLHNHLRSRGFLNVVNLDYEPLAADRGCELEHQAFGDNVMKYVVADATRLADDDIDGTATQQDLVRHGNFDLVIDKSTADAIACAGPTAIVDLARGVSKCLTPGGVWISLSLSSTRFDVPSLPLAPEVLAKVPVPKPRQTDPDIFHWCYALRRRQH